MWVLVLLAFVWVVALAPPVLRRLRERELGSSVTSFNRQLSRLSDSPPRSELGGSVPGVAIGFGAAAKRLSDERFASDAGAIGFGVASGPRVSAAAAARTPELGPLVSHATTIRRRRVVASLGLGTLAAFAMGFGMSVFFYVAVGGLLVSLAYLGLLAYFHQLAVERVQKVVALETRRGAAIALDQARHHSGGGTAVGVVRPRVGGSGWSVPESEFERRRLVSAGR
ncbi:MAG: hypothetical protein ACLQK4_10305 [Acidimicrobiales bacterium]|jgi:hypothetical protein